MKLLCLAAFLFLGTPFHQRLFSQVAEKENYLAPIIAELKKDWPTNRTINIVCHGHSVPSGYFKTPVVDTFNAYPHLLHRAIKEQYPHAVVNVIVTAIGGENSISGAARFERDVLTHKPDVVCIDYSLNDRRAGLDKTRAAWTEMIKKALATNAKVILLTPTADTNAKQDDPKDLLNQHAEQVRQLAAEFHVGLADSLALFRAEVAKGIPLEKLMSQFNHPNAQGHALVARGLSKWFLPNAELTNSFPPQKETAEKPSVKR